MRPIFWLIKQELKSSTRGNHLILSFLLAPLLVWGIQGVGFLFLSEVFTESGSGIGETIFLTNEDNSSSPVQLEVNITLPFDLNGVRKGENVSEVNLADYFVAALKEETKNNQSLLFGYYINDSLSEKTLNSLKNEGQVSFWIEIPENFSDVYSVPDYANINLNYLTTSYRGPSGILSGIAGILSCEPFSIVNVEKSYQMNTVVIELGSESGKSEFNLGIGLAGYFTIFIAAMVASPFVSASFAGEREKKTMEALLALPFSRQKILLGKLSAALIMVAGFAVMNLVGIIAYIFIMSNINNQDDEIVGLMTVNFDIMMVSAFTISLFLACFTAIGIGIAIACVTNDIRTSETLTNMALIFPTIFVGMICLFIGVPEEIGGITMGLYLIPWTHVLAIFQKITRPGYFDVKALLGSLWLDILFHLAALMLTLGLILYIASKVFEREDVVT